MIQRLLPAVRICLVLYRFIDLFDLVFRVNSLSKQAETIITSTTNHEYSDFFFLNILSLRYRLKFSANEL